MRAIRITSADWLMVGLLGLTCGSTYKVMELTIEGITPFWLAAIRIDGAAALMCAI
ncbi:MAG: hypothetical protein MK098_02235 [Marinovum sp.]|nr:hypothetical protein [Marinovum sp.]